MFAAKQFRAKAAENAEALKHTDAPERNSRFTAFEAKLQRSRAKRDLAGGQFRQNDPFIARRTKPLGNVLTKMPLQRLRSTFFAALGAAIIMQWNTIPTKLQRELFDTAGSLGTC